MTFASIASIQVYTANAALKLPTKTQAIIIRRSHHHASTLFLIPKK